MRFAADAAFALIDDDAGGAVLFSDYRRALVVEARSPSVASLRAAFAAIEAATAAGDWVVLAADYGLGAAFEPAAPVVADDAPRLRAWVFGRYERLDAEALTAFWRAQVEALPESSRSAGIAELQASLSAAAYAAQVGEIKRWISEGDCYQVNLTFPLSFRVYGHPLALYAGLRQRQPVRYGAFVSVPEATLLSFSPELFFERRGDRVLTRPMKGTAPRGASPAEDEALRAELLASAKERAENVMIVDLLRNDLGRLARPGEVRVEALCETEAYPTLWQQVSSVAADLPGVSLFELFGALFPCGSITGAPKIRAMQRIAELEQAPRGLYTGALGWVAPGGDCRFNVAIRTFETTPAEPDQRVRLGVGSGIVIDADPAREYAECLLKARFLTGFDPGFALFETMRLEDGRYPLLSLHLDRLLASAQALGFNADRAAIEAELAQRAAARAQGVFRVRLSLAHGGAIESVATPLDGELRESCVTIAEARLPVHEYLRGHKTTARRRYDEALARLPEGVFDTIFLNENEEVCEGARSSVFIVRDGVWLTPPLACGVLPGVMRRVLVETRQAVEQVLTREDLLAAREVYVANALRGVLPVRLIPASP